MDLQKYLLLAIVVVASCTTILSAQEETNNVSEELTQNPTENFNSKIILPIVTPFPNIFEYSEDLNPLEINQRIDELLVSFMASQKLLKEIIENDCKMLTELKGSLTEKEKTYKLLKSQILEEKAKTSELLKNSKAAIAQQNAESKSQISEMSQGALADRLSGFTQANALANLQQEAFGAFKSSSEGIEQKAMKVVLDVVKKMASFLKLPGKNKD